MTTLPRDFDIFLRSGIEHPARDRGIGPRQRVVFDVRAQDRREQPGPDDVVGLRAQVHRKHAPEQSSSSPACPAICGVSEEVAHVSITSGSPTKPPGGPRWAASYPAGTSVEGSTGSASSRAAIGLLVVDRAVSSSGYQTGNGTPKKRWRLMHQSPVRPPTQSSKRARMYGGMPAQLAAARDQRVAVLHRADEPLTARDDLQRALALLEELHRRG